VVCGGEGQMTIGLKKKILVLFAHPRMQASVVQTLMLKAIRDLDDVTVHDLYGAYPDFLIDVQHEQDLLAAHDVIVFQHPFYWYSSPAIIKEWQDLVLENGWAYGAGGDALAGKYLMNAISTGGHRDAYKEGGRNRFALEELLRPFDQTAYLCGMAYLEPFAIFSGRQMDEGQLSGHAEKYRDLITGLRDGRVSPVKRLAEGHDLSPAFIAANKGKRHAS
jgi:glutathione-regulated potassium-efflux system ancillary protein KefG